MQSGKIKHWDQDKGYGFIDVDNQSEDVFFHVSKVRLSQPISIGQQVYFNSERNNKSQLRATEVTSTSLSLLDVPTSDTSANAPKNSYRNTHYNTRSKRNNNQNNNSASQTKKSSLSTLFSLIAIIAVAIYFLADLKSTFFDNGLPATTASQTSSEQANPPNVISITGDAQIDNTITLIKQGGPFPYPNKDGTTFYNREGRLPAQSSGYYREYTVPTPGASNRGARRIITGGNPPTIYYFTADHYYSFTKLNVGPK